MCLAYRRFFVVLFLLFVRFFVKYRLFHLFFVFLSHKNNLYGKYPS